MLEAGLRAQLQGYLEGLQETVEVAASIDDSAASGEMLELLRDIALDVAPHLARGPARGLPGRAVVLVESRRRGAPREIRRRAHGP